MTLFKSLFFILFIIISVEASIHEDAEDKKTSRWKRIPAKAFSSVTNIKDLSKKSRVLEFQGDGTKQAYEFKTRKTKKNEYWLSWQMKFSEDFVIIVLVQSNVGKHYLVYTPGIFKGHMQYGLGDDTSNGKWQTVRRNLQEDIAYFDNRVKTVSLKSFVVKGNGRIDNIITKKIMSIKKMKSVKILPLQKYKQKKVLNVATNSLPVITVRGVNLVELSLGDAYVEEGVSAYDKEDGDLNVVSMENIDSHEVGRYMVLYMTTDSDGNMALDKRYVHVGNVEIEETSVSLDTDEQEEVEVDYRNEKTDFLEEEEQIRIWEKELELREKELAQREKKSNKK
jgi:hypothetical protein